MLEEIVTLADTIRGLARDVKEGVGAINAGHQIERLAERITTIIKSIQDKDKTT